MGEELFSRTVGRAVIFGFCRRAPFRLGARGAEPCQTTPEVYGATVRHKDIVLLPKRNKYLDREIYTTLWIIH